MSAYTPKTINYMNNVFLPQQARQIRQARATSSCVDLEFSSDLNSNLNLIEQQFNQKPYTTARNSFSISQL